MRRDTQKSKLYRAERKALNLFDRNDFGSAVECEIFVGRVLRSERAKAAAFKAGDPFGRGGVVWPSRVKVRAMKANAKGANASRWLSKIAVAPGAMTKAVMLHELAHICTPSDPGHGPRYAAVYLALVRAVLGTKSERALKAAFKAGKVRFRPKRSLSPERKAALVATLKAAREKRAAIKTMSDDEYLEHVARKNDGAIPLGDSRALDIVIRQQDEKVAALRKNHDVARTLSEM